MKILDNLRAIFAPKETAKAARQATLQRTSARSLLAAMPGVSANDITQMSGSANQVIRAHLSKMRSQSRAMALNNDYAKNFLRAVEHHVVGPDGVRMQNKARDFNGSLDRMANRIVEGAWGTWCKQSNSDVRARVSFRAQQKAVVRTMARDGEAFYRKVRNFRGSAHRFALQQIPAELIDESYWDDGRRIVCGIEFDEWGKALAYYIRQDGAFSDSLVRGSNGRQYLRIDAAEMIHVYIPEFSDQVRGIPWTHTAMIRLHQLGAYEEAEIVAARLGASKMGFLVSPDGGAGSLADGVDHGGAMAQEVSPGQIDILPSGYDFKGFDPTHPSGNFGPFIKATLRGISSGLGVSYNALANDLEGVNFSSIRAGLLEEREHWRAIQRELREQFLEPVFGEWMDWAMLSGALSPLPASKQEKFNASTWQFRGWAWVDPERDINAANAAIASNLRTRTDVLAEQGKDFEEVLDQLAEEAAMIEEKKLGTGGGASGADVQASAMNGAQVQALQQVIAAVGDGSIPPDTATALIAAAFPLLKNEQIAAMVTPLKNFKPTQPQT